MLLRRTLLLLCFYFLLHCILCDDGSFFLKVSKNVPRIGKRNKSTNNDDSFEKFFLKASKSVPRIGRRNKPEIEFTRNDGTNRNYFARPDLKYPTWSELADHYEYNPELFNSPQYVGQLEEYLNDDPSIYDWEKVRMKRNVQDSSKKELNEYKYQA